MPIWLWIVFGISWFPVGAVSYRFGRYFLKLKCDFDLDRISNRNWIWYKQGPFSISNPGSLAFSIIFGYLSFVFVVILYILAAIVTAAVYFLRIVVFLAGYKR